jgi:hypothetical protein
MENFLAKLLKSNSPFYFSGMKTIFSSTILTLFLFTACNSSNSTNEKEASSSSKKISKSSTTNLWKGSFSNGMKGATLSFVVEGDELKELTFAGYWRCDRKLELTTLGPEENFPIKDNKVDGVIIEPKDGPAPFHYELNGSFNGDKAEGTLNISNVAAGCTTYKLNWTAERE